MTVKVQGTVVGGALVPDVSGALGSNSFMLSIGCNGIKIKRGKK